MSAITDIWSNIEKIIPSLNSSRAGIARRITEVVGSFIDIVRLEMLRSEQTVEQATKIARITSRQYYVDAAYNYQEGHDLVVINEATQELGYAETDVPAQIIRQATIGVTSLGVFFLNVATADSNNNVVPLTDDQLDAFGEYYFNFIAMGAQCTIASNEPAVFTASHLYIRFYKTTNLDVVKGSVYQALHDLQVRRRDNARLYINEIESYLNSLDGVRDAYFADVRVDYNGSSVTPKNGIIDLEPGYFNFDPALYDWTQNKTTFEAV